MLKHFLKDGLGSRDPSSRSAAVVRLDASSAENQQKLVEIARADSDEQVRCAAIARLTDVVTLDALSANHATPEAAGSEAVVAAARLRLEALIVAADDNSERDSISEADIAKLLNSANVETSVLIACHCQSEPSRQRALEQLSEVENLVSVVIDSRFHATRAVAADRLSSVASMETALMGIKTRDKEVARSLQHRISEIVTREKQAAAHQQDIEQLLSNTHSLASSVWSPQYAARLTALQERWDRLDPAPTEQQQAIFAQAQSLAETQVLEHQQKDQAMRYCHEAVTQLDQLILEFTTASLPDVCAKLGEWRQRFSSTNASWRISEAAVDTPAGLVTQQKKAETTLKVLFADFEQVAPIVDGTSESSAPADSESQLNTLKAVLAGAGAAAHAEAPGYVELADVQKKLETMLRVRSDENLAKIKSVKKQIAGASAAIAEKRWSQASSLFGRAQKKLDRLKNLPEYKSLHEKLLSQQKKLQELGDWVDFAAEPKLKTLCEQMEALPEKGLSPKELAPAIKTLQEEWKAVGVGPCSNELWPRFKTAGDKAFEPCALYFASRTAERTARTDNKQTICSQLETYLEAMDWEAADWKTVEKTLRAAKNEWRNNRVSDRKPDKSLESRFTNVVSRFNEKLNVQYDANAEIKTGLIEKAKALAEAETSQHVVNQTRRLQSSWKQTGVMRRKQDQLLWEEFNGFCQQIHRSHRDLEKAKTESGLAHVKTARDIIKKLRTLARAGEPDEKAFNALQDQFNALAEFPERDRKFLFRDFNQAGEQFSRLRDSSTARHAQSEITELKRKSELCSRYEALVEASADPVQAAELDAEWDDEATSLPRDWNKKILARRAIALKHLQNKSSYDFEKNDKARRLLCIQAEILSEKETPAEDKSLRMAYQLEALQQGLGQSTLTDRRQELHSLLVEWLTLEPASTEQRDRLEHRFQVTSE